ncbi:hypothetical protein GCM10009836_04050 [Pseudonocardia ailaonensis]|uniref:Cobalamin-independent methionine synthase MetE C-terminal/archaeal domain-containing protein n=1 Tax=Pseudonocardia ailaonensis TaxID=367279 RepID=A0ABN2MJQ4_9PSEU
MVGAVDGLDADVTTVEAARSKMEVLADLGPGVPRALGPGVYDVHSPEVLGVAQIVSLLTAALGGPRPGPALGKPGLRAQDAR